MEEDCTGSQRPQQTAAVEDEKICDTDSSIQLSCNSESSIVYSSSETKFHTNTHPYITICFQTAAVNKVVFATGISVLTAVNIKTALL